MINIFVSNLKKHEKEETALRKILFCATIDEHFTSFHLPTLKWFKDQGWEVHVAASGSTKIPFVDQKHDLPIQRSPFHAKNVKAYKVLKNILNEHQYEIIHCHTPMGGVLSRFAARQTRKKGTKVLYTAHGFHFCKGAPLLNWLIYYPIEKVLSYHTDCLVTINNEDYQLAHQHHFSAGKISLINGVGVDTERFNPVNADMKGYYRFKNGYKQNDFLMFYAAEFNQNKNQQLLIHILHQLKNKVPNVRMLLAGDGLLLENCKQLAKQLGVSQQVDFLGYRKDVYELLPMCDIAIASSLREGLPVNILEAMACEIPVVATINRGHCELIQDHNTGCLFKKTNLNQAVFQIDILAKNHEKRRQFGKAARQLVIDKYSIQKIMEQNRTLYQLYMGKESQVRWIAQ
jgi:glycosyltransferase EpsD